MTMPYNFVDLIQMPPGALIGGLVRPNNTWRVAPDWELPKALAGWKSIKLSPFLEHRCRWRQHLRKYATSIKGVKIYRPPLDIIRGYQYENRSINLEVPVDKAIGMYLGHFLRFEGVCLVNVLTSEGYDVWI